MTDLTRDQVEEWERIAEEGDESTLADLASRIVPILCRALLNMEVFEDRDRWKAKCERYEAEARAGRPFLTVRDGRLYITDGISVSLLYSTNAAAYAAARAACEAAERGGE